MKKTNKKGFTIVELVIVIAVIAILAAVLIPTFANVTSKAKESAALQGARAALTNVIAEEGEGFSTGNYIIESGDYFFKVEAGQFKDTALASADVTSSTKVFASNATKIDVKGTDDAADDLTPVVITDLGNIVVYKVA